jgi:hypothetical protein
MKMANSVRLKIYAGILIAAAVTFVGLRMYLAVVASASVKPGGEAEHRSQHQPEHLAEQIDTRQPALRTAQLNHQSAGWACTWTDGPRQSSSPPATCIGVVHCRHRTLLTLMPTVRQVACLATPAGTCEADICLEQSRAVTK